VSTTQEDEVVWT